MKISIIKTPYEITKRSVYTFIAVMERESKSNFNHIRIGATNLVEIVWKIGVRREMAESVQIGDIFSFLLRISIQSFFKKLLFLYIVTAMTVTEKYCMIVIIPQWLSQFLYACLPQNNIYLSTSYLQSDATQNEKWYLKYLILNILWFLKRNLLRRYENLFDIEIIKSPFRLHAFNCIAEDCIHFFWHL